MAFVPKSDSTASAASSQMVQHEPGGAYMRAQHVSKVASRSTAAEWAVPEEVVLHLNGQLANGHPGHGSWQQGQGQLQGGAWAAEHQGWPVPPSHTAGSTAGLQGAPLSQNGECNNGHGPAWASEALAGGQQGNGVTTWQHDLHAGA